MKTSQYLVQGKTKGRWQNETIHNDIYEARKSINEKVACYKNKFRLVDTSTNETLLVYREAKV
ncbi:MAG: hypothetical protein GY861_16610 [bacterium]|nr:hypothetical protein [bacterium]